MRHRREVPNRRRSKGDIFRPEETWGRREVSSFSESFEGDERLAISGYAEREGYLILRSEITAAENASPRRTKEEEEEKKNSVPPRKSIAGEDIDCGSPSVRCFASLSPCGILRLAVRPSDSGDRNGNGNGGGTTASASRAYYLGRGCECRPVSAGVSTFHFRIEGAVRVTHPSAPPPPRWAVRTGGARRSRRRRPRERAIRDGERRGGRQRRR